MSDKKSAEKRINELKKGKEIFMSLSRTLAEKAQKRESVTIQPKEKLDGTKATITIRNYLGGNQILFTIIQLIILDIFQAKIPILSM